jgi:hypothetical protein
MNNLNDWFDPVPVLRAAAAARGMQLEVHLTRSSPTGGPLLRLVDRPAAPAKPRRRDSVLCAIADGQRVIRL